MSAHNPADVAQKQASDGLRALHLFTGSLVARQRLLIGRMWPELQQYGDTTILIALAAACFVNFGRNRTLHCGLTGPLFLIAAVVALLIEAGIWSLDPDVLWGVVLIGVALAFLIEWRTVPPQRA